MRILFCQGGERWKIDDCGKAYTSGSFDERIWERYKLYGSELTVMFAEERKRYNSGLLPTKYNFFDETKYNRISLVDEINPKVNTFNILISKSKNYEKNVLDTKRDEFYLDAINSILSSLN